MQSVLIVVHLMIVAALIGLVLLQRSEGGGLGTSAAGGFMTNRGTANVLSRTTAFLAIGFFLTSLLLSWMAGLDRKPASIVPGTAPAAQPGIPADTNGGNLLDSLRGREQPAVPQSK